MDHRQLVGSYTARGGFKNENDIVLKFNDFKIDNEAQLWLKIMGYDYLKIQQLIAKQVLPIPCEKEKKIKTILHLCADLGSDSRYYQLDPEYQVIMVGEYIGVENFIPPENVHGIIANPVCTEFSTAQGFHVKRDKTAGLSLLSHCQRIIEECVPNWWVIENPANGTMNEQLGTPDLIYQPWQYGSPWTKKTALWGKFTIPEPLYTDWEDCPKNPALYVRPGRPKPALASLHKSAVNIIPEMQWAKDKIKCDADIRSMCSDGFAKAFYLANK